MESNNWYVEWIEEMWNKCPNCDSIFFDIIHRKCLECGYELQHNTFNVILPVKSKIEKVIKNNKFIFEDPYDSKQKWFLEDRKYWWKF